MSLPLEQTINPPVDPKFGVGFGFNEHGPAWDKHPGTIVSGYDGNPPASGGHAPSGYQGVNGHGPAHKPNARPSGGWGQPGANAGHAPQRPGHTGQYRPGDQMPGGFVNAGWIKDPARPGRFVPLVKTATGTAIHPYWQHGGNGRPHGAGHGPAGGGRPAGGSHGMIPNQPHPGQGSLAGELNKPAPFTAPWLQGFTGGGGWLQLADGGWFNPNTWTSWKPGDPIPGRPGGGGVAGAPGSGNDMESQVYAMLLKAFGGV